jgi:hypothetical protein
MGLEMMEMMKLPISDTEMNEDEIEGLVSTPSAVGGGSPRRLSSPNKSMFNSNSVWKRRKLIGFLACVAVIFALFGLSNSNGNAVEGGIDILSTEDKPSDDYYDQNSSATKPKTGSDDDTPKNDSELNDIEDSSGTEEGSSDDGGTTSGTENSEKSDVNDDTIEVKDGDGSTDSPEISNSDTTKNHSGYQFPKEQYTTDTLPWTRPISDEENEALIEKWGNWHFWDGDPDSRPTEDYMAAFPNRDCPFDEFPNTAWQADAVYVNHMLDSAGELVARAKDAIYTEYGYGPRSEIDHDQLKTRREMFKLSLIDLEDPSVVPPPESLSQGGWSTRRSLAGLARRLLHAMMTNDSFTIVIGGHSAAAGHGNHFLQNYAMQMYKALKPIFDRVGVELIVRNEAQGGLGTMQHGLGSADIYGDDVDMLMWDSAMTEKEHNAISLYYRQALIGGKRAPVLWGGPFDLIKDMFIHADGKAFPIYYASQFKQYMF